MIPLDPEIIQNTPLLQRFIIKANIQFIELCCATTMNSLYIKQEYNQRGIVFSVDRRLSAHPGIFLSQFYNFINLSDELSVNTIKLSYIFAHINYHDAIYAFIDKAIRIGKKNVIIVDHNRDIEQQLFDNGFVIYHHNNNDNCIYGRNIVRKIDFINYLSKLKHQNNVIDFAVCYKDAIFSSRHKSLQAIDKLKNNNKNIYFTEPYYRTIIVIISLQEYNYEKTIESINPDILEFDSKNPQTIYTPRRSFHRGTFFALTRKEDTILEIGPFSTPFFRRNDGYQVKYFDIFDAAMLKKRAEELNVYTPHIPSYIDYVSEEADLSIISEKFTIVFSAHVIEHQQNLIKHLQEVQNILYNDGVYFLAIPDKRYCFDHFKPISDIADTLTAWYMDTKVHSLKIEIQKYLCQAHNIPWRHWNKDHGATTSIIDTQKMNDCVSRYLNEHTGQVSTHSFYFTPKSFIEIMTFLYENNYIQLKLEKIFYTRQNTNEFYAIMVMKEFDKNRLKGLPFKFRNEIDLFSGD